MPSKTYTVTLTDQTIIALRAAALFISEWPTLDARSRQQYTDAYRGLVKAHHDAIMAEIGDNTVVLDSAFAVTSEAIDKARRGGHSST
jgi:hypothetical protein